MKKILLALGVACVALSGMAASSQMLQTPHKLNVQKRSEVKDLGNLTVSKVPAAMKKIAPGLSSMEDVITSVEGEKVDVTVTSSGLTLSGYGLIEYQDEMLASHVVYGIDNEVYIYEIFPYLPTKSYIKGVKDGDKIKVDLPQAVYYDDSTGVVEAYCYNLLSYQTFSDESGSEWSTFVPEEQASLTFSITEDGSMVAEGLSKDLILGAVDSEDGQWIGLGAWDMSISTFTEEAVKLPDGYEVSKNFWTSVGDGYGWQVNFAQGGEELYFQGLSERMPEAWVKGTVKYDDYTATVSIAQEQYVGDYMGYHIFTKCVKMSVDEDGNVFYDELMDPDYVFQLVWDFEEETMTAKDKDVVLLFNTSKSNVYFLNDLIDMKLIRQESFEGTPLDPYALNFEDVMEEEGYSIFSFFVPGISAEGDYLLIDDLSYVVYVDGEEWTFDAEEYELEESFDEVPWAYDGNWIIKEFESSEHAVAFFVEGISTLGVQTVYRHNGEETRSNIVTIDLDPSSAAGLDADKKVSNVKYYDIAGREVTNPASGLVIKRVTYEDGTSASFKKMAH